MREGVGGGGGGGEDGAAADAVGKEGGGAGRHSQSLFCNCVARRLPTLQRKAAEALMLNPNWSVPIGQPRTLCTLIIITAIA